jgi:hypothetical protein
LLSTEWAFLLLQKGLVHVPQNQSLTSVSTSADSSGLIDLMRTLDKGHNNLGFLPNNDFPITGFFLSLLQN